MFVPGDPRFDEILLLAMAATSRGLQPAQRPRWRELITQLLGSISDPTNPGSDRRAHLRADIQIEVHLLSPDEHAGLVTTDIGPGGLCMRIPRPPPAGTRLELSIAADGRPMPLFLTAEVMWSRGGDNGSLGAQFIDAFVSDREYLEGLAVRALLAEAAAA